MNTHLQVRLAHQDDLDDLAVLFDGYRVFYQQASDFPLAKSFLAARMDNHESTIFVAYCGAHLLGFVQLYPIFSSVNARKSLLLNDLFVIEQARGKGAGKALLNAARDFAQQTQACWIMLQTQRSNTGAQALYEKLGYKRDDDCYYYYL